MSLKRYAAPAAAALIACAAPAAAQVQVTLNPLAPPEAFFLADFLPGSGGVRPDLIGITLVNNASPPTDPPGAAARAAAATQTISLEVVASRESPAPAEIFRGSTAPFVLDQPVRRLTIRDLVTRGRDVSITDFTVNDQALEQGGRSGRLPAGTYLFRVIVHGQRGEAIDSDELRITTTAPSRVELLSPGGPADVAPPVVLGPTPRFIWSADGEQPGARYRLRVVKVDEGTGSAVEALQSGFPAWDAVVNGTSAIYPASVQALRLEPGAAYAWQVTRELRTSGGTEVVESPIYWFRLGGPGGATPGNGALALRFAALLRALGLSELEGFTPIGALTEDGRPIPLDRLEALLAAIEAGEVPVLATRVR